MKLYLALAFAVVLLCIAAAFNALMSECVKRSEHAADGPTGYCDLIQLSNIVDPPK
jgi:hypothetical protein